MAGTALVGSQAEGAERIEEYHRLGIEEFILSGPPHVEEAYRFAEGVLPLLRDPALAASRRTGRGRTGRGRGAVRDRAGR
ncbi:hypothetical protein [Streptomyces endophytica]|uniref:Alkanesulfonate monooxygenase n=1 Tax=Streptomyces endophytica TaxID=2991496 RepID=A0ABY6PHD9_9ACTN|nr:hypothetical protein [Streptomyces endophytica]UZJ33211.1 hypothetical protein OJ254_26670 [Streptomyces endophytica]